jgi:prepilin-type N-terminal cleavage/methylation domain-containing protein
MKTIKSDQCQVSGVRTKSATRAARSPRVSRFTFHVSGFTLIELLVVIAIMGTLAALLLPVVGQVRKHQYIYNAQAEMAKLETAIDRYKSAYGFYPPDNQLNPQNPSVPNPLINQLYYELVGTVYNQTNTYTTLDGSSQLPNTYVSQAFGVGGFLNCTKPNGDEGTTAAKDFLPDLKPNQIAVISNNVLVTVIITAAGGPDNTYQPLGPNTSGINPWRYNSSNPTNNPGSYDLWIQLSISGKTNLICNWSKSVQIGSPLP